MATASLALDSAVDRLRPAHPCRSTDGLGERIAALAARLHAATYELLVLLREFDDRTGWNDGFALLRPLVALAHRHRTWARPREKVRVAHALATLPPISATMARGAISYAKVRALTRVATPENEAALLDFAQAGTAAHVERFVRAWRRVDQASRGGAGRVAAPASAAVDLGRRRRHGRDPRPPDARGGRRRPARARGCGRSAVPRGSGDAEGRTGGRGSDAGTAAGRRPRSAGRGGAGVGPGPRVGRRPLPGGAARGRADRCGGRAMVCPGRWRSTTARWTFPRRRRDAFPATRRWCRCDPAPTARSSTSGARRGQCRPRSAARSRRATGVADFRAARPAGAMPITSSTGSTAARPASTTWCSCAGAITGPCTKADSRLIAARRRDGRPSCGPSAARRSRRPRRCPPPLAAPRGQFARAPTRSRSGTARRSTSSTRSMCSTRLTPRTGMRPDENRDYSDTNDASTARISRAASRVEHAVGCPDAIGTGVRDLRHRRRRRRSDVVRLSVRRIAARGHRMAWLRRS